MERHPLARLHVPDGHHVRVADGLIHRQLQHAELDGVERIDPTRPPLGILVHPVLLATLLLERAARGGNQQEAILHPLPPRELREAGDGVEELAGVEPRVVGDGLEEFHVRLRVDLIAGAGGNQARRLELARPDGRGVAERTVDRDARTAVEVHLGEPDRQLFSRLPLEPERRVAARTRHLVGEHARQNLPDPIRNPLLGLGADRPVLELFLDVLELRERLWPHASRGTRQQERAPARDDRAKHQSRAHSVFRYSRSSSRSCLDSVAP